MFALTGSPIVIHPLQSPDTTTGGWVSFEGRVRSLNEGRQVLRLDYEVYEALALKEGNRIVEEAKARFGLLEAYAIHRHGTLAVGDTAIWVYAASMHRREAFEGTEHIIHTIKHTLPIWKKEYYADGSSQWVGCKHTDHA